MGPKANYLKLQILLLRVDIIPVLNFIFAPNFFLIASYQILKKLCDFNKLHGETFYINFYYSIFKFREKRIALIIFVSKNTNLYNNDVKL